MRLTDEQFNTSRTLQRLDPVSSTTAADMVRPYDVNNNVAEQVDDLRERMRLLQGMLQMIG